MAEPEIVAFTCNWCAYAGADYAGVSRIQYPPNVRIIRVMCAGRVEPSFILRALEEGADGVLVGGCHEADCHYISGNLKARDRVEDTRELLSLLGLGDERLRIKWVNANEGEAFAEEIKDFTKVLKRLGANPLKKAKEIKPAEPAEPEEIMDRTNAYLCVECGKCTASCPVARRDPEFSPRYTVEQSLEKMYAEVETGQQLWDCLTCRTCEERCPHDVRFSEFIRDSRVEARSLGLEGSPAQSGQIFSWMRMMSSGKLKQDRLGWLDGLEFKEKATAKRDVMYFVGCLPYFDVSHRHIGSNSVAIARDSVAILNALRITPVLLADECCCGHDLLFAGDPAGFEALAKRNAKAIKAAEVKRIVVSCPECYQVLAHEYPRVVKGWDVEVVHISEIIAERLEAGKLEFKKDLDMKVTYQDPCRLGRYMDVYSAPRKVLEALPGVELLEMEHHGPDAICCGVSSWVSCGATARSIQVSRLSEARSTGAETLVTACPKCQIHLRCALSGKLPGDRSNVEIRVEDLTALVAKALGVEGE
ncbi:MAG: hydrogenase iron-sulfur subunit [Actinobacteria bacterium]|nr:hydrogenase iron-sulfur subunit [Actinomycetota bacterium]MBU4179529.1 hydrogenase iron-sulfur subunit [Actinomycetota bacterium]MBU4217503.1 hydrogenase iron-sulfur subunit [Actinomycetota bacterium]MBU4358208.1 hydrogenase iron-sulfur subunit [Actinomycetota bacterium]MBU4392598.1 hydrogenase iron-sulfur subunit [Actinomycetota bacterium]